MWEICLSKFECSNLLLLCVVICCASCPSSVSATTSCTVSVRNIFVFVNPTPPHLFIFKVKTHSWIFMFMSRFNLQISSCLLSPYLLCIGYRVPLLLYVALSTINYSSKLTCTCSALQLVTMRKGNYLWHSGVPKKKKFMDRGCVHGWGFRYKNVHKWGLRQKTCMDRG